MNSERKHIGIVVTKPPVYSEQFLKDKIEGLIQLGYQVTVFSNAFVPEQAAYKVVCAIGKQPYIFRLRKLFSYLTGGVVYFQHLYNYYRISRKDGSSVGDSWKYLFSNFHILTQNLDWLHFEFSALAYHREYVAKALGCKMSVSIRGYDMALSPLKKDGILYNKIWQYTDQVHAISDHIIQLAYQNGMPKKMKVVKINPAVNSNFFPMKKNKSIIESLVKLVSVGRLHWVKGYNYIFLALKELSNKGIDFRYTIVGEGKALEELIYLSHMLGISDKVNFMGKVEHEHVYELLSQSDIFIQFSVQEGFSNAVLEAQALGLMVVVSDAGGLEENVIHGHTGWVVKKRDFMSLANTIIGIVNMQVDEREKYADAAIQRVKENFDIEKQRNLFGKFYES